MTGKETSLAALGRMADEAQVHKVVVRESFLVVNSLAARAFVPAVAHADGVVVAWVWGQEVVGARVAIDIDRADVLAVWGLEHR